MSGQTLGVWLILTNEKVYHLRRVNFVKINIEYASQLTLVRVKQVHTGSGAGTGGAVLPFAFQYGSNEANAC